jgi:hypothetical protein
VKDSDRVFMTVGGVNTINAKLSELHDENERLHTLLGRLALGINPTPEGFGHRVKHGLELVAEVYEVVDARLRRVATASQEGEA